MIPNDAGRVIEGGVPISGMYAVGWIKRGPSGIIGTNKPDSLATVDALLEDVPSFKPCDTPDTGALLDLLQDRKIQTVSFQDWKRIDAAEVERGQAVGKPREKFATLAEMLSQLG